jgi:hypothetical protein
MTGQPGMRPTTGDRAVDDILGGFDAALAGDPAAQVVAATAAHRALQERLTAPTPPPPGPGEARPGPRA